ncbi:MAG TPA: DNA endonuclease SmrA [Porticoccaceae bacterium]|nr:DNA endonuclease SmrA [Porticoccaceae bacterium]
MADPDDDFRALVGEVEPLRHRQRLVQPRTQARSPGQEIRRRAAEQERRRDGNYLARAEQVALVAPWDTLDWKRDGVQHGVFKNLRQGRYPIDARLDLHQLSVEQARLAVFQFARDAVAHDIRCGLISHGRGEGRNPPALLKSCVNHWLRELDEVLAFHSAERRHGGVGATYVLFRKSAREREENRERHGLRTG